MFYNGWCWTLHGIFWGHERARNCKIRYSEPEEFCALQGYHTLGVKNGCRCCHDTLTSTGLIDFLKLN